MQNRNINSPRGRNIRLALMLALLALCFYGGFILMTGLN